MASDNEIRQVMPLDERRMRKHEKVQYNDFRACRLTKNDSAYMRLFKQTNTKKPAYQNGNGAF